ncbi:MAG: hypothetical protein F6K11_19120 [Leptolyngbya sp. SIO3F4]|nr:hypothetical protein [Leptolyngbya sp. SIO3F4]
MHKNMRHARFLCILGLSALSVLGNGIPALSESKDEILPLSESENGIPAFSIYRDVIPSSSKKHTDCSKKPSGTSESSSEPRPFETKRIELSYYRNALNVVNLVNELFSEEQGCATLLPTNTRRVGRGGGNIILLYGTEEYIEKAYRLIAPLDLPLPGIDLQLWGIQISSEKPDSLARVMADVRSQIGLTQQLVRDTFGLFQLEAQFTLAQPLLDKNSQLAKINEQRRIENRLELSSLDRQFGEIAYLLGYEGVLTSARRLSILDVLVVGKAVEDPSTYYKNLYSSIVRGKIDENGRFRASDERYQEYFDAFKKTGRPPFERVFRARGLEPYCIARRKPNSDICEQWEWAEIYPGSVEIIDQANRRTILEFAFQYADFVSNPGKFDPAELQRSSETLNSEIQQFTNLLQQDIEDLFVRPTLRNIQARVADSKSVSFAQVGRTTIATLSGVETVINSSATSAFEIPDEPGNLDELLKRAQAIEHVVGPFIPTETIPGAAEASVATAGPVPISQLVGLVVALTEQSSTPIKVDTGTNLTFTPGVLRDLNSAELNILLRVVDPTFTPTQESGTVNISRVGQQELRTSVYTQALDFFDLSTFTSQATLNGGRAYFPVIGQLWHAIFGSVPVIGDLFSVQREPQNVLHENLLLTNSFITPTSLGLGLLYPIEDSSIYTGANYCVAKVELNKYLNSLTIQSSQEPVLAMVRSVTPPIMQRRSAQQLNDFEKNHYLNSDDRARCGLN